LSFTKKNQVVVINPAEELVHCVGNLRANDYLLQFFAGWKQKTLPPVESLLKENVQVER
jgi:hypothetical protein